MIHIDIKDELEDFNDIVRIPGEQYLLTNPHPTSKQFNNHAYWRLILEEFHEVYGGICAYSCHWIPYDTGADTVEHVRPKVPYPEQAYEWTNYRLVCATLNGRKWTYEDVLDPASIETGWFQISFPSLLIKPNRTLKQDLKDQIQATIGRLKLNDESTCLKSRLRYIKNFCQRCINFTYLENNAPFIAMELQRQGLVDTINDIMGYELDDCALDI